MYNLLIRIQRFYLDIKIRQLSFISNNKALVSLPPNFKILVITSNIFPCTGEDNGVVMGKSKFFWLENNKNRESNLKVSYIKMLNPS